MTEKGLVHKIPTSFQFLFQQSVTFLLPSCFTTQYSYNCCKCIRFSYQRSFFENQLSEWGRPKIDPRIVSDKTFWKIGVLASHCLMYYDAFIANLEILLLRYARVCFVKFRISAFLIWLNYFGGKNEAKNFVCGSFTQLHRPWTHMTTCIHFIVWFWENMIFFKTNIWFRLTQTEHFYFV